MTARTSVTVAERPGPSAPRPYEFPPVAEHRLANGLRILVVDMPGRPLVSASLLLLNGAVDEPADVGGATVLAARALSEGTGRYDAIQLTEASERLGASLHAEAGWDALTAGLERAARSSRGRARACSPRWCCTPRSRNARWTAFGTSASTTCCRRGPIPAAGRMRRSSTRSTHSDAPYHRPAAGTRETVASLGPAQASDAPTSGASIPRGPRSLSVAALRARCPDNRRAPVRRLDGVPGGGRSRRHRGHAGTE